MSALSFLAPLCVLVTACSSVAESSELATGAAPNELASPVEPPVTTPAPTTRGATLERTVEARDSSPNSLESTAAAAGAAQAPANDWSLPQGPGAVTELGVLGFRAIEVGAVLVPDAVPHQDTTGGTNQVLTALAGSRDSGFVAAWRDPRDGSSGLYFLRLTSDLEPREPERSASIPHTMRRADPAVTLAPDGSGAVVWTAVLGRGNVPYVRGFDEHGALEGEDRMASAPVKLEAGDPVMARAINDEASCNLPTILRVSRDRTVMVWTRGGRVQWLEPQFHAADTGAIVDVDTNGMTALAGAKLCASSSGVPVCLWNAENKGAVLSLRRGETFRTQTIGAGTGDAIAADVDGGFWVLLRVDGKSVLRHAAKDLRVDRPDVVVSTVEVASQKLAAYPGGVAVLVEPGAAPAPRGPSRGERMAEPPAQRGAQPGAPAGGQGGRQPDKQPGAASDTRGAPRLYLVDAQGQIADPAGLEFLPGAARGAQNFELAGDGKRLLVAWTDVRNGDGDIYGRLVDPAATGDARLLPDRRLNTDTASGDQVQGTVAAAGEHGWTAWADRRGAAARIYVRRIGRGGFEGDEIALPTAFHGDVVTTPSGGVARPTLAVRADGDVLCVWRVNEGRGKDRLVGQILGPDGAGKSALIEIDAGGADGNPGDPAAIALNGERGYLVGWSRGAAKGVWTRRLAPDGSFQGLLRRASEPSDRVESDVDLALLDDGRVMSAWTAEATDKSLSVRGRFLKDTGEAAGDEIGFEHASRFSDWDPSLAPADQGGFAMSWTSGANNDPVRDVVVRVFDARGRPRGPYVTPCFMANEQDYSDIDRMADGSFAVVWEDDVSYADQTYVRRISRDGASMGGIRGLNETETKFMPDRVAPRIARLGDGFVAAFGDRRRGQGFDVRVKVVGAKFDAPVAASGAAGGR